MVGDTWCNCGSVKYELHHQHCMPQLLRLLIERCWAPTEHLATSMAESIRHSKIYARLLREGRATLVRVRWFSLVATIARAVTASLAARVP